MPRSLLIGITLLVGGAVATPAQELAEASGEQTDITRILQASGTLYVLETHDLPSVAVYRSGNVIECEIVILRFLSGAALAADDQISVGLRLTIDEDDRYERTASIDIPEAEALLASFKIMSENGQSILASPSVHDEFSWRAEIHYATKEQVKMAAFINRNKELQFALKVGSRADWAILTRAAIEKFAENLEHAITVGRILKGA